MKTIIALIFVTIASIMLWNISYPFGVWRYRMTVSVDTPMGIRTGSAMREVSVKTGPDFMGGTSINVKGEAVMVGLGSRGTLFALMRSPKNANYAYQVLFDTFKRQGGSATPEGVRFFNNMKTSSMEEVQELPVFVRFRDLKDPKTAELVDPRDFELSYGAGVKLIGVTIDVTSKAMTSGIRKILPPFGDGTGFIEGPKTLTNGRQLPLNRSDFVRGMPGTQR
ncbi:MAG: hypothetical protein WC521_07390 [Bdellovibrionales bacterium]|jgi:hypothetical protein